jgi:hypothetical protein
MGLNTSIAKLLVRARLHGASFTRTATIGRQSLAVPKKDLKAIARKLGIRDIDWSRFAANGFADDFFRRCSVPRASSRSTTRTTRESTSSMI